MGREGEVVGREEQDETRQGRAELKCGGKPFLSVLRFTENSHSSPRVLFVMVMNSDLHTVNATYLCRGMHLALHSHNPTGDNVRAIEDV